jgi:membrane-associated phospholipid phosphatase
MRPREEPFVAWPGWLLVGKMLALALPVTLWWVLVYHGANWVTSLHTHRVRVHLDAELAIPMVPAFVLVYLAQPLVYFPAPFVLRSLRELQALALSLVVATGVAGVGFLLVPAELAYPCCDPDGWSTLFAVARELALPYNLVPSLHVAMGCICLAAYATRCGAVGKALLATCAAAICLSTVLTHQHHLLDVATGLVLAMGCKRLVYDTCVRHGERPLAS